MFAKLQLVSLLALLVGTTAVVEPRSGIDFILHSELGRLTGFGLRRKGPIKACAVGVYEGAGGAKSFNLRVVTGISSKKMTDSLKDALKPRCIDEEALNGFESVRHRCLPRR